jgi:non-ribosomal peptide synthetase component F
MTYTLVLYEADGASDAQRREAEQRFRTVLEETLGDASLVAPVYAAYLRIVATYGEAPAPDTLTDAEQAIFDQWQAAETAAVAAVFGPHRYMGDAMYEIRL